LGNRQSSARSENLNNIQRQVSITSILDTTMSNETTDLDDSSGLLQNNDPLETACEAGDITQLELLQNQGVDLNSPLSSNGKTAFHLACETGNLTLVEFLISREVDLEKPDIDHKVPIHYACKYGHLAVIQYLHQRFAVDLEPETKVRLADD